jgi:hypothetical protein
MFDLKNLISLNKKLVFGSMFLFVVAAIAIILTSPKHDQFDYARREVLLRRLGHEILLQSGDSTSTVLPIKKIASDEYQISFENAFSFQPDFLINIATKTLSKDPISADYVVNVLKRGNTNAIYGFAIAGNQKNNIISCNGRNQPSELYVINVKFKPKGIISKKGAYLLGGLPFLAFIGLVFFRSAVSRKGPAKLQDDAIITLGGAFFDVRNRKLLISGSEVYLTATETRLLSIFTSSPNLVIERNRLQKEIWEDEGVIVGRSLDMFISKLRKKLEPDPKINITVVRGKGYKLEVNA